MFEKVSEIKTYVYPCIIHLSIFNGSTFLVRMPALSIQFLTGSIKGI